MNRDVLTFLRQFLALFPSYASRPFYIAGESYAGALFNTFQTHFHVNLTWLFCLFLVTSLSTTGHYIPWLSVFLLSHPDLTIDLRGVAIGNGWSDPPVQNGAYADFANGAGILDSLEVLVSSIIGCDIFAISISNSIWF